MLEAFQGVAEVGQLVIGELRKRLDVVTVDHLLELGLQGAVDLAGSHQLRQPSETRTTGALGEDLGKLADQHREVSRVSTLTAALELDTDDVEAALDEPAQEAQARLDGLALRAHLAHVLKIASLEVTEVVGAEDLFELWCQRVRSPTPGWNPRLALERRVLVTCRAVLSLSPSTLLRRIAIAAALSVPLAACGGGSSTGSSTPTASVTVKAKDTLTFDKASYRALAGPVSFTYTDDGNLVHTLVIEAKSGFKLQVNSKGETDKGSIDLTPGTYTIYCDIAGHRAAGMHATLTVG